MSKTAFPGFLVRIESKLDPGGFGSGTVLGPDLVATCGHVVHAKLYRESGSDGFAANSRGEWAAAGAKLAKFKDKEVATVYAAGGHQRRALLIGVHDHLDLVLLRLDTPVPFLPVLEIISEPPSTESYVHGFDKFPGSFLIHSEGIKPSSHSDNSSRTVEISSCQGSIPRGTSGGPVINDDNGRPRIAGLAVLGDAGVNDSRVINGNAIQYLIDQCPSIPPRVITKADKDGAVASFFTKIDGLADHCRIKFEKCDETRSVYIGSRPILCVERDAAFGSTDDFTLAHLDQAELTEGALPELWPNSPLRGPLFSELLFCYARFTRQAHNSIAPNLPVSIFDLSVDDISRVAGMPLGRPEWYFDAHAQSYGMAALSLPRGRFQPIKSSSGMLENQACLRPVLDLTGATTHV